MNESNLTLYVNSDFVSAFAMSAFVALEEKRLNFVLELIDLKNKKNYLAQLIVLGCFFESESTNEINQNLGD